MTLTFVAVFIFRSFQILVSTTAFCLANAMRLLISLVQSPSADLYYQQESPQYIGKQEYL